MSLLIKNVFKSIYTTTCIYLSVCYCTGTCIYLWYLNLSKYLEKLDGAFLAHFSRRLSELIIEQGTRIIESHGITTPTTAISSIYFLMGEDKVTVADLADALAVTHQMATQRVNSLEKLGLVFRKPNPEDKRAKSIHLTELGTEEGKKLRPITEKINIVFEQLNDQIECDLMAKIRQAELALIEEPLQKRLKELDS